MPYITLDEIQFDNQIEQEAFPSYGDKSPYDDLIGRVAEQYQIDPTYIRAMTKAGSDFNSNAAGGLMQVDPKTVKTLKIQERDPIQNVMSGAQQYKAMLDKFKGDYDKAAAAYILGGPGKIQSAQNLYGDKWLDNLGVDATKVKDYIDKINRFHAEYNPRRADSIERKTKRTKLNIADEKDFQKWYKKHARNLDLNSNPDDPKHYYDYRAAYKADAEPDKDGHWPSTYKEEGHPRLVIDGVDTRGGTFIDIDKIQFDDDTKGDYDITSALDVGDADAALPAALIGGLIAMPIAGLAGIKELADVPAEDIPGLPNVVEKPGYDPLQEAGKTVERIASIPFKHLSEQGQKDVESLFTPMAWIDHAGEFYGDAAANVVGPTTGAAVKTLFQYLAYFGLPVLTKSFMGKMNKGFKQMEAGLGVLEGEALIMEAVDGAYRTPELSVKLRQLDEIAGVTKQKKVVGEAAEKQTPLSPTQKEALKVSNELRAKAGLEPIDETQVIKAKEKSKAKIEKEKIKEVERFEEVEKAVKEPWEMTESEFLEEYRFHGTPKLEGDKIKPGTFFSDYAYAKGYAKKAGAGPGTGEVYAVRKTDLKGIPAEKIDIFGQGEIETGASIRSGKEHRAVKVRSFDPHKEMVAEALAEGKTVPAEVLKEYPELTKKVKTPEKISDLPIGKKVTERRAAERKTTDRRDIKLRKPTEEMSKAEIAEKFLTDELTGMPNRQAFERAPMQKKVGSIDLDKMKKINDTYGDAIGDQYLQHAAKGFAQSDGLIYRLAGDDFTIKGNTTAEINANMAKVNKWFDENLMTIRTIHGKPIDPIQVKVGVSHGIGESQATAFEAMKGAKEAGIEAGIIEKRYDIARETIASKEKVKKFVQPAIEKLRDIRSVAADMDLIMGERGSFSTRLKSTPLVEKALARLKADFDLIQMEAIKAGKSLKKFLQDTGFDQSLVDLFTEDQFKRESVVPVGTTKEFVDRMLAAIKDPHKEFATTEGKRIMFDMQRYITENPQEFADILKRENITPEQAAIAIREALSYSGKTLQQASQVAKLLDKTFPDAGIQKLFEGHVPSSAWNDITNLWMRVDRVRRTIMVSQLATAQRNIIAQMGYYTLNAVEDAIAGALKVASFQESPKTAFIDFAQDIAAMSRKLTGKQKTRINQLFEMYPELEAELLGSPVHDIPIEGKATKFLMFFNRMQENFFRKTIFDSKFTAEMKKMGLDLNNLKDLTGDQKFGVHRALERSLDTALEMTFAKTPNVKLGKLTGGQLLHYWNRIPGLTTIQPYPRFWANAMKFLWDYNPTGAITAAHRLAKGKGAKAATQALAKSMVGTAMLGMAMEIRKSKYAGEKYYELKTDKIDPKTGKQEYVDLRAFAPFTSYLFLAEALMKPERLNAYDWTQGMLGINRIAGTGLVLVDALRAKSGEGVSKIGKEFAAQYLSGFTVGFRMFKDIISEWAPENAEVHATKDTWLGPTMENLPLIVSETMLKYKMPKAERLTRAGGYQRKAPLQRQLTGITRKDKTTVEREIDRLNLKNLYPRTGDAELNRKILKGMNLYVDKYLTRVIESPSYEKLSDIQKGKLIRAQISKYKGIKSNQIKVDHYTEKIARIDNYEDQIKYLTKLVKKKKLSERLFKHVLGQLQKKNIKIKKEDLRLIYDYLR